MFVLYLPGGISKSPRHWWRGLPSARRLAGSGLQSCLFLQGIDGTRVGQSRSIPQIFVAFGDRPQDPAHDLAASGLREVVGKDHVVRTGEGSDLLTDVLTQGIL